MQKNWSLSILGLVILVFAAWYNLEAVGLKPEIDMADLLKLLSTLLFIALIVERVLEVFISAWRGEGKEKRAYRVAQLREGLSWWELEKKQELQKRLEEDKLEVTPLEKANREDLRKKIDKQLEEKFKEKFDQLGEAEKELALYRINTKLKTVPCGLFLGILVSALGFRTLQPLLDPSAVAELSRFHATFLRTTDVMLTGGLIGGGSDGIHKVIQAFVDFMESTSKRTKAAAQTRSGE